MAHISALDFPLSEQEALTMGVQDIINITNMGDESQGVDLANLQHPKYSEKINDWQKWRLTYESKTAFILEYLEHFSKREDSLDFAARQKITYVPAFAKAAINEVKDAIFQRTVDVTREGGSKTYQEAIKGLNGGVDLAGSTMNSFIGKKILTELLSMGKVGIYVDMPQLQGETLADQEGARPYIYQYKTEDILNWDIDFSDGIKFNTLLLREIIFEVNEETGLPDKEIERFRYIWKRGGFVLVQFFNSNSKPIDRFGFEGIDIILLKLPVIPFIIMELSDSLLADVANYQIALLNLASSDMSYTLKANFPFYVEAFDPRIDNLYQRPTGQAIVPIGSDSATIIQGGEVQDSIAAKNYEIKVGTTSGRRYPKGLDRPGFIHPSSEPLKASMAKQDELKRDIRILIKLAIANITPTMASAESKSFDERSLEAGLSAIGLELEFGERHIAKFWQLYERSDKSATVTYPEKYSLQSERDKRNEAQDLTKISREVPSLTYKQETMKEVTSIMLGTKVSKETLDKINKEIDSAEVISEPEDLTRDVELGLIDLEAASAAKGYPEGSVEKAKTDHADRVARIAESQAKARGTSDLGGIANASRDEKLETSKDPDASKGTRGEA